MLKSVAKVAILVLSAVALTGCGTIAASQDPTKIIHISNRTSAAAVVQGGTGADGDTGFRFIVTQCGGQAIAHPAYPGKPSAPYNIGALLDLSGALSVAIEQANGDLNAVAVPAGSMTIIWSRGQQPVADLPQWLTITPDGVTFNNQPVTDTLPTPCAAWSASPDTQASASP
jgi:hypothetical protein